MFSRAKGLLETGLGQGFFHKRMKITNCSQRDGGKLSD